MQRNLDKVLFLCYHRQCKGNLSPRGDHLKNKVEQLRKERGLNQGDLAKLLYVSRQTISSIETGKYNPSLDLAFAISDFFGRRIEEIFIYERGAEDEKK